MLARYRFILATTASLLSCQPTPQLDIRIKSLSIRDMVNRSAIVIIGKAEIVTAVGPEVRSPDQPEYPLRLERVTVQVEKVVKGMIRSSPIVFYRYGWPDNRAMVGPWSIIRPGQRYLFFLDLEDSTPRSLTDLYPAELEVLSGKHVRNRTTVETNVDQTIAEILLTPGEDLNPEAFAQGLWKTSVVTIDLVGRAGTLRLLKTLLASKQSTIGQQACLVIAERFYGQESCISELTGNRVPNSTRVMAEDILRKNVRKEVVFKESFSKDPMDWVRHAAGSNQPDAMFDVLEALAFHSDPQVMRQACDLIAQNFPAHYKSSCSPQ